MPTSAPPTASKSRKASQPAPPAPVATRSGAVPDARQGTLAIRLADRHRWIGGAAAFTAMCCFLALWLPNFSHHTSANATGATYLFIGLALSGAMLAACLSGRGVLMAGAALLLGVGPWGPEYFLTILFFVYALFLMGLTTKQARSGEAGRIFTIAAGLKDRLAGRSALPARKAPAASSRYTPARSGR